MWCPTAEKMCKSKWIAGNDALKLFTVPLSLQLKSDNPYPRLNEGLFFHRSFGPGTLKDFSLVELLFSLPLCPLCDFKGSLHCDIFFSLLILVTVIDWPSTLVQSEISWQLLNGKQYDFVQTFGGYGYGWRIFNNFNNQMTFSLAPMAG